ncbi:MAG: TonB-dependent receptor [Pseudomonadota bacterium]
MAFALSLSLACAFAASDPTYAQTEERVEFDIPAGSLANALNTLAQQAGIYLSGSGELTEGKTSRGLKGSYTADVALERLLQDTDLDFSFTDNNTVTLVKLPGDEGPLTLAPIKVKGELLERDIQDTQTSVVISTGEELLERGETSLNQTLRRIPGVHQSNRLVIRGIADDGGLGNGTTSSTISVTTDGIRLSDFRNGPLTNISTWDVEQVEVFRGSQSTQSGRNALAGAITVEGAKPKFSPEYQLRLGITEDERFEDSDPGYQAALVMNTPLVEDQLAARLSVDARDSNGDGDVNNQTIRAGLHYEPTKKLALGLTYTDIDNSAEAPQEIQSPRLTAEYQINNTLTFTSRTQYTDALTGVDLGIFERERDYETIDQEFRLIHETDRLRVIGGLFYTSIDELSVLRSGSDTTGPFDGALDEDIETENYAVYGEMEYDLSSNWTIITGLRYDVEDVVNTQSLNGSIFGIPVAASGTLDTTYDALLPKLGAVYNFDEYKSLSVTYQRGYRAGGISVSVPLTGGEPTFFEFDPEFTDTLETAYRFQTSDGRHTFNANIFYTQWTDQQVSTLNGVGIAVIGNTADSDLLGAEFDYRQFVNDNLDVFASAAFVRTEYGEGINSLGVSLRGKSFPGSPELTSSVGAKYSFENGLSIGGDVNYTSSTFSDPANSTEFENDAYWITNVNANYEFENGLILTAYARNLFNEIYTTQQTSTGFVGFGPKREYGVYLTMNL